MLRRPKVAEILEGVLRRTPGVREARANPVTGGVLVLHDSALTATDIGELLRNAVDALSKGVAAAIPRPSEAAAPREATSATGGRAGVLRPALTVAGGAAAILTLGRGRLRKAVLALGAVTAATAVVVRRAWRKTLAAQGESLPHEPSEHTLLRIVGPHKGKLCMASALSALCQVTELALSVFLGWIALVLIKGECAPLVSLGVTGACAQLWFLACGAAVACAAAAALSYAATLEWRKLGQAVQHDWRNETYAHVQKLELSHLEGERTSRISGVLTAEISQMGNFFATSANDVVQLATSFLVLVPAFLLLAPQIAWIAFLPMPVVAWLSFHYQDRVAADYAVSSENKAQLHSQLVNTLEASATVKSFCAEEYEAERIDRLSESCRESDHRTDRSTARHSETIRVCTTASMAGTMLLGGLSVLNGTLPFEVFSPLIGLPQQVLLRLTRLSGIVDQYQRTLAAYDRVEHLRSLPVEPDGHDLTLDDRDVKGAIALENVSFSYPGRPPALDDLSLSIAPGQVTGIVGATGAGKTTIAKLLMRFQDAEFGHVLLDGQDIRRLPRRDLRKQVGFVAQDPFLFDGTIAENIRYGSFEADDDSVVRAARMAEAHGFIEALPDAYDTLIGERGAALSGGQKQRIALARAMLKDAPVVILDEATSAVDNETEAAIQRTLRGFAKDRTLVIIAHRLSTIRHSDRIYVMDKGGVVAEQGTHDDLLARDGLYASLWNLQAGEKVA
ncbi:ABC transporter ATP-binding protein [Streptomyces colonosanans]|uniref:ABC transporter ATP-binding protein n=1 Tax=Streptomyces colonosanans TaxID=1428652 RepID=UPI000AE50CC8|nr:ABC transporter ATP-binding protein [Streptomyces colonosanans]